MARADVDFLSIIGLVKLGSTHAKIHAAAWTLVGGETRVNEEPSEVREAAKKRAPSLKWSAKKAEPPRSFRLSGYVSFPALDDFQLT
jgi:hypothetical protein